MAYILHRVTFRMKFMHHVFQMQEVQGYCQDCCAGAEALHAASVVMRDFRSPNVLTRHGAEGMLLLIWSLLDQTSILGHLIGCKVGTTIL